MAGWFRILLVALFLGTAGASLNAMADDPPPQTQKTPEKPAKQDGGKLEPSAYGLFGEDPPKAFVPKSPRSVADRKRIEGLQSFAAGCSLEAQGRWGDALKAFQNSLQDDPSNTAAVRRMAKLHFALGQVEDAVKQSRKVLETEPGDIETLTLLINHYRGRRNDLASAEKILRASAENPKLDQNSPAALLIQYELGKIYAGTQQFDKAATAFGKVVDGLDGKAGGLLTPPERRRILSQDEAQAYMEFGLIFLSAKRTDLAIRAFQRGLIYEAEDPQLLLLLGRAYLEAGNRELALGAIERFLKRQPAGREAYDLLVSVLVDLKRDKDVIPRLENAVKDNPKNIPLQFLLAERYRAAGDEKKARELSEKLIALQPNLQGFVSIFPTLLKEKNAEEIIRLFEKVMASIRGVEMIQPQLDQITADSAFTDKVLDTGLKMLNDGKAGLSPKTWFVLLKIGTAARRGEKLSGLIRWAIAQNPPPTPLPLLYRELVSVEFDLGRFNKAEEVIEELIRKFPEERTARTLVLLGQVRARAGKTDQAITTLKDALRQEPNDGDALQILSLVLNQAGKSDEALQILREALKVDAANVQNSLTFANLLVQSGKTDEAITFYKGLIDRFPGNDELVRIVRSSLSLIYTNRGDFAKGEAELEILFSKTPDDPGVNNDLGYLYADQGKNLEKAEGMIRKAVTAEPDNSSYLDSLGWVLFKRGKFKEALEPLEKAVKNPANEDATILEHLGDVYFELKDLSRAKSAWTKAEGFASKAKPPDRRLPEIRKKLESLKTLQGAARPANGANP